MNKKHYLMMAFVSLLAAATFCACSKDDDEGGGGSGNPILGKTGAVAITIENGADYSDVIDEVRLVYGDMYVASRADYNNGSFTIDLPASVADKYLEAFEDDYPAGFTISNPSVKGATAWLSGYQSDKRKGSFRHSTGEWTGRELLYVTGDVSITGTAPDGAYNVHLKKGWNLVYEKKNEVTTSAPAGAKWQYK
ncbi:MAG: hypothetical protein LBK18_10635 [Prevotellaceae bacterium]|jgi:hypothetical protein|nr:hypothetical protein [Prevotellaceae bacterium]